MSSHTVEEQLQIALQQVHTQQQRIQELEKEVQRCKSKEEMVNEYAGAMHDKLTEKDALVGMKEARIEYLEGEILHLQDALTAARDAVKAAVRNGQNNHDSNSNANSSNNVAPGVSNDGEIKTTGAKSSTGTTPSADEDNGTAIAIATHTATTGSNPSTHISNITTKTGITTTHQSILQRVLSSFRQPIRQPITTTTSPGTKKQPFKPPVFGIVIMVGVVLIGVVVGIIIIGKGGGGGSGGGGFGEEEEDMGF